MTTLFISIAHKVKGMQPSEHAVVSALPHLVLHGMVMHYKVKVNTVQFGNSML